MGMVMVVDGLVPLVAHNHAGVQDDIFDHLGLLGERRDLVYLYFCYKIIFVKGERILCII